MNPGMKRAGLCVGWVLMLIACARSKPKVDAPASGQASPAPSAAVADASAGAAAQGPDAPDASPAPPAQPADARPFASNAIEATSMMNDAIDAKGSSLIKCIEAARLRRKNAHGKIVVEVGIDQEGTLIGVKTPKGQPKDPVLSDCIRDALTGANFPRSHAGVITVKRSFEDQAVTK
jgi:nucleoid-associated protein YgaU